MLPNSGNADDPPCAARRGGTTCLQGVRAPYQRRDNGANRCPAARWLARLPHRPRASRTLVCLCHIMRATPRRERYIVRGLPYHDIDIYGYGLQHVHLVVAISSLSWQMWNNYNCLRCLCVTIITITRVWTVTWQEICNRTGFYRTFILQNAIYTIGTKHLRVSYTRLILKWEFLHRIRK